MTNGPPLSPLLSHNQKQEKYENNVLPKHEMPGIIDEYKEYFTYETDQLRALTIEECGQISLRLSQYSIYIQRCCNRDKSKARWLKSEIRKTIAPKVHTYYGRWEFQEEQAIKDDTYAQELNQQLKEIECRIERFDHISLSIKNLADQYKNLQFSKIKERES